MRIHSQLLLFSLLIIIHGISHAGMSLSDNRFLQNAAQAGVYETEGSQLALKVSKNSDIQKFAKEMVREHSQANAELKNLAAKKKIELPETPSYMQRGSLLLLESHSGRGFDEEYAQNIGVDAHEAAVELFTKAANEADDIDIKKFAAHMLPTLKHHLDMARTLNDKFNPKAM